MSRSVSLKILRAGWCQHLECMADRGGRLAPVQFPALCGLIQHPDHGWILYDTGYAEHFFQATRALPERLYRSAVPVQLPVVEQLGAQLHELGIGPGDIRYVIIPTSTPTISPGCGILPMRALSPWKPITGISTACAASVGAPPLAAICRACCRTTSAPACAWPKPVPAVRCQAGWRRSSKAWTCSAMAA